MSKQKIHKGFLITGGLLGLGLLGYILFRNKDKENVEEAEFTIIEPFKKTITSRSYTREEKELEPKDKMKEQKPEVVPEEKKKDVAKAEELPKPNDEFPLKLGSKGKRVEQLQVYLLKNHGAAGLVTEEFDLVTQKRVERFLKVKQVSKKLFEESNMDNSKKKKNHGRKAKH